MTLLLAVLLRLQDVPERLVERLSADRIEDREEAALKLEELGAAAVAPLERAARDADEEVAGRARDLLLRIGARAHVTRALARSVPGAVERVVRGDAAGVLLEVDADLQRPGPERRFPAVGRPDLVRLFPQALRQATASAAKFALCEAAARHDLRSAFPELVALLRDDAARACAVQTLRRMAAKEAVPDLVALLSDGSAPVRLAAATVLRDLDASEVKPSFVALVADPSPTVRAVAAHALGRWGARDAVPALTSLLRDESSDVRWWAERALVELRVK
jgi:hypothetical protein